MNILLWWKCSKRFSHREKYWDWYWKWEWRNKTNHCSALSKLLDWITNNLFGMNFVERHGQTTGKQNLKIIIVRDSIITTSVIIIMLSFAIDKVFQKVNGALHHFYKHRKNCNAALYKWPEKSSLNVDHVFLSALTDLGLSPKKGCFYALPFYCNKYDTWNPTANDHSKLNWYYPPVGRSISQDGV